MCCRVSPLWFRVVSLIFALSLPLAALAFAPDASVRPKARAAGVGDIIPNTRWDHRRESDAWTRAALDALKAHGTPLVNSVPRDIGEWCPGYAAAAPPVRRAFWVGFLSALAKHESTWRPDAVGGGDRWFGLLQILPATARGYDCRARTGSDLQRGAANLSCAIRIMAVTVPRDGVIHAEAPRWSGVAADWGPLRSLSKRTDMANWLRAQDYCQRSTSPRPRPRPQWPAN